MSSILGRLTSKGFGVAVVFAAAVSFYNSCGVGQAGKLGSRQNTDADWQSCQGPVAIARALSPSLSCYHNQGKVFDTVYHLDNSRKLTPWIPCNRAQLVSMASSTLFNFDAAVDWVATKPLFDPKDIQSLLQDFARGQGAETHGGERDGTQKQSPAVRSPNHQAMVKLIRSARKSIFFNAIIFGGEWATELIREMLLKNQNEGVEIVILRDTENSFAFASELAPVWNALQEFGYRKDGVTVIRSNIKERRISGIPFGSDQITKLFSPFAREGISLSGRSDHSKILVVDGFESEPAMFVSSKNPSDYNLLNYDESVIVEGPAAAAAQVAYIPDLKIALEQWRKDALSNPSQQNLSQEDQELLQRWFEKDRRVRSLDPSVQLVFKPAGGASVRILENNGDDSVRNVELGVLQLLANAKKNIRIYNFLTYNPRMARAIALAANRLGAGNVRVLADATLTFGLNITFEKMLRQELVALGSKVSVDDILKWRLTAPPRMFKSEPGRVGITQQQHTKSIIVDDRDLLVGSTNFDFASMAGAFREFSVAIRNGRGKDLGVTEKTDPARESSRIFDAIWNDSSETVFSENMRSSGGPTAARVPSEKAQQALINIMRTEQDRLGALQPDNIENPESCD